MGVCRVDGLHKVVMEIKEIRQDRLNTIFIKCKTNLILTCITVGAPATHTHTTLLCEVVESSRIKYAIKSFIKTLPI